MQRCPLHTVAFQSRQDHVTQDLPFAVSLTLPNGEKPAAIDRELTLFERPDFSVSRFIRKLSVDDDSLRIDFRRARETRALEPSAIHLLDFASTLNAGSVDRDENRTLGVRRGNRGGVASLHCHDKLQVRFLDRPVKFRVSRGVSDEIGGGEDKKNGCRDGKDGSAEIGFDNQVIFARFAHFCIPSQH